MQTELPNFENLAEPGFSSNLSQHAMYHVESFSDFSVSLEHRQAFFDVCSGSKVCTSCVLRILCSE